MDARSPSRGSAFSALRFGCVAILVTTLACGAESFAPSPLPDGSHLYWALALDQHAVNLSISSPYDTLRLTATPRTATGDVLTDVPVAPRYRSGDTDRLQVSDDGLIRALSPGEGIPVIATLTVGNIAHVDTALVDITTNPASPALQTFSIHPVPPDSAIWEANNHELYNFLGPKTIVPHDSAGAMIVGLAIYFTSSDTTVARIDRGTGQLTGLRPGQVTITASTMAYGVVKADTIPFTITMPAAQMVSMGLVTPEATTITLFPSTVTIAAGGSVMWFDYSFRIEITFDDPTNVAEDRLFCHCGGGNIPLFGGDTLDTSNDMRGRSFPVPGTYIYHLREYGGATATGTVIVDPPPTARRVQPGAMAGGIR